MKYTPLILLLFLVSGCSTSSRMYRKMMNITPEEVAVAKNAPKKKTSRPEMTLDNISDNPPVISAQDFPVIGIDLDRPAEIRNNVPMTFSAIESEHVSSSSYDPFLGGSSWVVSLDELSKDFHYPYPGNKISPYGMRSGRMHTGTDIKCVRRDTIRAAFSGVVRMSKMYGDYGNVVVIRNYNGLECVYSHNDKNLVKVNDVVRSGDPVSLAGRTGRATTEHLHFELRAKGRPFNPEYVIDCDNRTIKSGNLYLSYANGGVTASNSRSASSAAAVATTTPSPTPPSTATATSTATVSPTAAASTRSSSVTKHTVVSGDTLYAIARKYGTTVAKICQLNGISENKVLSIGEKLIVK